MPRAMSATSALNARVCGGERDSALGREVEQAGTAVGRVRMLPSMRAVEQAPDRAEVVLSPMPSRRESVVGVIGPASEISVRQAKPSATPNGSTVWSTSATIALVGVQRENRS